MNQNRNKNNRRLRRPSRNQREFFSLMQTVVGGVLLLGTCFAVWHVWHVWQVQVELGGAAFRAASLTAAMWAVALGFVFYLYKTLDR